VGSGLDDTPSDEAEAGMEDFKEIPGQFLRNLHGKWRKAKHFAMELPVEGKATIVLSKGKTRQIRVILTVNQHENIIHLKYRSPEDAENMWKEMALFKFWDHQADPRSNSYVEKNSIYQYFHEANPYEVNILKNANPEILKHLESLNEPFNRALYAIVDRKAMEKKKEDKSQVELRLLNNSTTEGHPHYGAVEKLNGKDARIFLKPEVLAKYHSADDTERYAWRSALDEIEYFDNLPDIKEEIDQTETKIITATSKYRIAYPQIDKDTATLVIRNIATKLGTNVLTMTADQLYDAAIKEESKNPDANAAKEILIKMGWKPKDAQYYVDQAKETLGPTAGAEAYMRKAKELKPLDQDPETLQNVQDAIKVMIKLGYKELKAKEVILKALENLGLNASARKLVDAAFTGKTSDPDVAELPPTPDSDTIDKAISLTNEPSPEPVAIKQMPFSEKDPHPVQLDDDGSITTTHPTTGKKVTYPFGSALPDVVKKHFQTDPMMFTKFKTIMAYKKKARERAAAKAALKKGKGNKPKSPPVGEGFINPFQLANFL
jgi:Holliday junction resolvasome RuvABC DNA-binding subunit